MAARRILYGVVQSMFSTPGFLALLRRHYEAQLQSTQQQHAFDADFETRALQVTHT